MLPVGCADGCDEGVVGFRLVGLALGLEFGAEVGDVEYGFVFGLLEVALALFLDRFDFASGEIAGFL